MYKATIVSFLLFFSFNFAYADKADVLEVKVHQNGAGLYSFDVTVKHADSGWKHYANKWDILDEKGNVLGTRILYHPHENEQPFTRSLRGIKIPETVKKVTVRAHDSEHGYGGKELTIDLNK